MTSQIYFDHNSTTPIDREVAERIYQVFQQQFANPASQHQTGQVARRALDNYRTGCLKLLDADTRSFPADQLIFTSGGTEANNLAILGHARKNQQLIISAIEHPSIRLAAEHAAQVLGAQLQIISVDSAGQCRLEHLQELLDMGPTSLVSLMLVNNETGVVQPVADAAKLCRARGVRIHCDAVQAIGKLPVSFRELGVDLLSFTPHKFNGPRGIGGLVVRPGADPAPILFGGFQQRGLRPGTEDVALAAGCHLAVEKARSSQPENFNRMIEVRDLFLNNLRTSMRGSFVENGSGATRSPHTLNLSFPGVERQTLLIAADVAGLAISTGSACSSGSSEPSPVLLAMGLETDLVESSIRVSFGRDTMPAEAVRGANLLAQIVNSLRAN
jgi:cysteine desulfurase